MKYLILFAIALVSQVYSDGEYWFDKESKNFKKFKDGELKDGKSDWYSTEQCSYFTSGTYDFRATIETAEHEEPEIVVTLEFIPYKSFTETWFNSLKEISVKEIKIKSGFDFEKLKKQTKVMGRTMRYLFFKGIYSWQDRGESIKFIKSMFGDFVNKLMKQEGLSVDQKINLYGEFAYGIKILTNKDIKDETPSPDDIKKMRLKEVKDLSKKDS